MLGRGYRLKELRKWKWDKDKNVREIWIVEGDGEKGMRGRIKRKRVKGYKNICKLKSIKKCFLCLDPDPSGSINYIQIQVDLDPPP